MTCTDFRSVSSPLLFSTSPEIPFSEESLRSFPILCTVDVPQVAVRTFLFVCLHDSTAVPEGAGSDILVFSIASALSSLLCTPLDVTRTQLILSRQGVERFSLTLREISERDGLPGLMAGWLPRLLWNGLIVGLVLGFCRPQHGRRSEM